MLSLLPALRRFLLATALVAVCAAQPRVIGVEPAAGPPGTLVMLAGTHLDQVSALIVGHARVRDFRRAGSGMLVFRVPWTGLDRPVAHRILLIGPGLGKPVESPEDFTVLPGPPPPAIADLEPIDAGPGARVVVIGSHLREVRRLWVGAQAMPAFEVLSDRILVFQMPAVLPKVPGLPWMTHVRVQAAGGDAYHQLRLVPARQAQPPAVEPAITGCDRARGCWQDRVTLTGTGLDQVRELYLGEARVRLFAARNSRILCRVPWVSRNELPARLRWRIVWQGAPGQPDPARASGPGFTVLPSPPRITGLRPLAGPPGTVLVITGSAMGTLERPATAVTIGGARVTHFLRNLPGQIWVQVPADAGSGPVVVHSDDGDGQAPEPFTATARRTPELHVACAYLTQAVQRQDGSVPLVAGREALLRVFILADQGNTVVPAVRARLLDAEGRPLLERVLMASLPGAPTAVDEDNLEFSCNLRVPGDLLQPGLRLQTELLPAGEHGTAEPAQAWPVQVREVPPLAITLVPVRWGGAVGNVDRDGRGIEDWLRTLRRVYPVGRIEVRVGPVFDATSIGPGDEPGEAPLARIRDALEVRRLQDDPASTRYYYGVLRTRDGAREHGMGPVRAGPGQLNRSAVGWDGSSRFKTFHTTMAHELGHCFGRRHTPAGEAPGPDPYYPMADGTLDASAVLLEPERTELLRPAWNTDIMGYGLNQWASAYTWEGVLEHLCRDPFAPAAVAKPAGLRLPADPEAAPEPKAGPAPAASRALLLHGRIRAGEVHLEPVFELPGPVPAPPDRGEYRLVCLDRHRRILLMAHFDAAAGEAKGEEPAGAFSLLVPVTPDLAERLHSLRIYKGVHLLRTLEDWGAEGPPRRLRPVRGGAGRDPVEARRTGAGMVRLDWDPREHPALFVRDPRSGTILAQVQGGRAEVATDADELELIRSSGWATDVLVVPVQ